MQKLEKNIGSKSRFERGIFGLAMILLGFSMTDWIAFTGLLFVGTIAFGEAFSGHCIYNHIRKTKGRN